MDELRRRNHWVPVAYLSAFTNTGDRDGLLAIRDRERPEFYREMPPHAIAKERDLYVIADPDTGVLTDVLERFLASDIEGPFVSIRNHLAYGRNAGLTGTLTRPEWQALVRFIAFQQVRTPAFRERIQLLARWRGALHAHSVLSDPEEFERLHRTATGEPAPSGRASMLLDSLESGSVVVTPDEKMWLAVALANMQELVRMIGSLPWRVFDSPKGLNLPSSDSPLVLVNRWSGTLYTHGGGWAQPWLEAVLPLSPRSVLVLGRALERYADQGSTEWFEQVRHRIATGAQRWLFGATDDAELAGLLYNSKPPQAVLTYPGGELRGSMSAMDAVVDLKRKNPDRAVVRFGDAT